MLNISETALQAVLRDIREGNNEHVEQFFASRPEWQETSDQGKQEEEKPKEAVTA